MNIEKTLESIFIAALEDDAYIKQHGVPVRQYGDNSAERQPPTIVVKVNTAIPDPQAPLYKSAVELMCVDFVVDDPDRDVLEYLVEACAGMIAELADDDGIVFHGNDVSQPADMSFEGNYQIKVFKFDCYFQVFTQGLS